MRYYVGITDENWYRSLMAREAAEANFWKPGETGFRALDLGGLFLFKLRYPKNAIVGGGHFVRFIRLPVSLAWQAFGEDNGVQSQEELRARNQTLAHTARASADPEIGCVILTGLFFFAEDMWVDAPEDWSKNIVSGKCLDSGVGEGQRIWAEIAERRRVLDQAHAVAESMFALALGKRRLGQGAFRALVTDAYGRQCSLSGERTLPVLQAAHIRPVTQDGEHTISNGILLRSDLHILFDQGLLGIDPDFRVHISPQIRDRYSNGRQYYELQGKTMRMPADADLLPDRELLAWHHRSIFMAS